MATVVQLAGFVCLAVAGFLWSVVAGFVVTGLLLVLIGHVLDGVDLAAEARRVVGRRRKGLKAAA